MLRVWEGPLATNWDAAVADWWVGDHCSNSTEFMEEPRPLNIRNPSFWPWSWSKKCFLRRRAFFSGVSWGWMENGTQARQGCEGGYGLEALRGAPWGWSDPGVEFWPNGSVLLAFLTLPFFFKAFFYTRLFSNKIIFPAKKRRMCVCEWGPCSAERERQNEGEKSGFLFNWVSF